MKITILGDEGVPVQVDGEAWIQPPGIVQIVHKNRAQMLTRDRVSVCVCVCSSSFLFFKIFVNLSEQTSFSSHPYVLRDHFWDTGYLLSPLD